MTELTKQTLEPDEDATDFEARWVREAVRARLFGESETPKLGRYEVGAPLGRGGMGVVYRATDPLLGRECAIKLLRASAEADVARLLREGRALSQLAHPNVVRIFDGGVEGEIAYLVIEHVEGPSLDAWRKSDRSVDEVIDVMLGAGSGLAAAHALGLVHRDVKPGNILIDDSGAARLGDFGLARTNGTDGTPADAKGAGGGDLASTLTREGAILGTPAYMPPEQLRGEAVDARADLFAYCLTFYEMLSGERPFKADSAAERERVVREAELPPVPEELAWLTELLTRGLSERAEDRWASTDEILDAIRARRESIRRVEGVVLALELAERDLEMPDTDLPALGRRIAARREDLDHALASWPENPAAQPITPHLEALAERIDAAIVARSHDTRVHDRYKQIWALVITLLWTLGFALFGWSTRSGALPIDNGGLTIFYAAFLALNLLVSFGTSREIHETNVAAWKLSLVTTTSYVGHVFVALLGFLADADVAMTLAAAHALATTLWLAAGVTADRRVLVVAPFTALGAIVTALFPHYCFDIAAVVALLGLGALIYTFRPSAPARD